MFNLQNNSTFPFIFCPKMVTRDDGKIVCGWLESAVNSLATGGNKRVGMCIMNEDGTMFKATSYTPTVTATFKKGMDFIVGNSYYTYIFMSEVNQTDWSGNITGTVYIMNSDLNITNTVNATFFGVHSMTSDLFFLNSSKTEICLGYGKGSNFTSLTAKILSTSTYTISSRDVPIPISNASTSTRQTANTSCISPTNAGIGMIHTEPESGIVGFDGNFSYLGPMPFYVFSAVCVNGFNGVKYLFGNVLNTPTIGYAIVNGTSTVLSSTSNIYTSITGTNNTLVTSYCKIGTNSIFITTSDGYLHKLEQDLSTGALTLVNTTTLTNGYIITASNNSLVAMDSVNTKRVIIVDKESFNKSPIIDLSNGTGFTVSNLLTTGYVQLCYGFTTRPGANGLFRGNPILNTLPCSLNQNLDFHNLMIANNGPGGVNNINYQKSSLVMGYLPTGEHKSINYVYDFNSFKFSPHHTKPAGTDLKYYYSLNNGVSWTICPEDTVVTSTGSTQIMIKADFSTSDNTITPTYLDYALIIYS